MECATRDLRDCVSLLDFVHLKSVADLSLSKFVQHTKELQDRKHFHLCGSPTASVSLDHDAVIFNYTDRTLSSVEKAALSKGLEFALAPNSLNYCSFLIPFEKAFHSLNKLPATGPSDRFKDRLKELVLHSFESFNPKNIAKNLTKEAWFALKNLANDPTIIICKPDKGNGIVLLHKADYEAKILALLQDQAKFQPLTADPYTLTIKRELKLQRALKSLKSKRILSEECYTHLSPSGSKPGILYGLPKVHKHNVPIRPILSAVGTYNFKLAKFLVPLLCPLTKKNSPCLIHLSLHHLLHPLEIHPIW